MLTVGFNSATVEFSQSSYTVKLKKGHILCMLFATDLVMIV